MKLSADFIAQHLGVDPAHVSKRRDRHHAEPAVYSIDGHSYAAPTPRQRLPKDGGAWDMVDQIGTRHIYKRAAASAVLVLALLVASGAVYARTCTTNCYTVGNQRICNTNCY